MISKSHAKSGGAENNCLYFRVQATGSAKAQRQDPAWPIRGAKCWNMVSKECAGDGRGDAGGRSKLMLGCWYKGKALDSSEQTRT